MELTKRPFNRATIAEERTPWYLYNFVKSYLYLLSSGQCPSDPDIEVVTLTGIAEPYARRPKTISVSDDMGGRYVRVADALLGGSLRFRSGLYHVSVFFESRHGEEVEYFVHVLGESDELGGCPDPLGPHPEEFRPNEPISKRDSSCQLGEGERADCRTIRDGYRKDSLDDVFVPDEIRRASRPIHFDIVQLRPSPNTAEISVLRKAGHGEDEDHPSHSQCMQRKRNVSVLQWCRTASRRAFRGCVDVSPVVLCIDDIEC